jgi:hypothetical protein
MEDKSRTITIIQEGNVRKGGSNTEPTTSRPSPSIQGFSPPTSQNNVVPPQSSQENQGSKK